MRESVCYIMYMMTRISHSLEETREIAAAWLASIGEQAGGTEAEAISQATLVGLSGHLGAGKTAFVKAVAKVLGVKEDVTSPTFVIMKIYETGSQFTIHNSQFNTSRSIQNTEPERIVDAPWHRLIHIDAYRLEKREELEVLNWEQLVADPYNLIMIEWPENVGLGSLDEIKTLKFEIVDGVYHISI
jgi:tRNA A37 threonylcarbamoyladenosine biosynthesis protein TsaE